MARRIILGEAQDVLKVMPAEQLIAFNKIRRNGVIWQALLEFVQAQKQIKLDKIYRLRRPKTQHDLVKRAIEHEYYAARIAALVVLLQIMENAADELEKRERKKK